MKKKKGFWGFLHLLILYVYIYLIRTSMLLYPNEAYMFLETIFLMLIVHYIHLIGHELGHYIFGRLTGYSLILFRIGSSALVKTRGNLEFKRYRLRGSNGQCLMAPDKHCNEDIAYILYNLGGVVINLIISLTSLVLYLSIADRGILKAGTLALFLYGLYMFFLNGFPFRSFQSNPNDGYNTCLIRSSLKNRMAFCFQLKINQQLIDGRSFRQIDEEFFVDFLEYDSYNHLFFSMDIYRVKRSIDMGNYQEARQIIGEILEKDKYLSERERKVLTGELIFLDIVEGRSQARLSEEDLKDYENLSREDLSINRLMYSYELLINQNYDRAKKYLDRLDYYFKVHPYIGEIEFEKEMLNRINNLYIKKHTC